jgi:hypothetical protein
VTAVVKFKYNKPSDNKKYLTGNSNLVCLVQVKDYYQNSHLALVVGEKLLALLYQVMPTAL